MKKIAKALAAASFLASLALGGCGDDDPLPTSPECAFEITTRTITSDQFIRNRFFRLNSSLEVPGLDTAQHRVELASIHVFRLMPPGSFGPDDLAYVAVYPDSNGDWSGIDYQDPYALGTRWREIPVEVMLDPDGSLRGIDLGAARVLDGDLLGVVYTVIDNTGQVAYRVGDSPYLVPPTHVIPGDPDHLYYAMKLLKAPLGQAEPVSFAYEVRNVYHLGNTLIDPAVTTLRIEALSTAALDPERDEQGMAYLRIFGLDREGATGASAPDGVWDAHRVEVLDLARGLLLFPGEFPHPFAGSPEQYAAYVNDPAWTWDPESFLARHQAPELYSPLTHPDEFPYHGWFRIVVETRQPVVP